MDRAPVDAVAGGDVDDLGSVEHLPHRQVTLLNHRKLVSIPRSSLARPSPSEDQDGAGGGAGGT